MSLNPRFILGALDLTDWPFAVEWGTDLGTPENVSELVYSLLQDGEIVSSTRTSNRTITLPVLIDEADMLALAEAEAALIAECDEPRNTLTVDPGDGVAPSTVFDTFRAQASFKRDDDEELNGFRRYVLTVPALPFGRSVAEVVTVGVTSGASPVTAVINDGSAVTNWTQVGTDGGVATAATAGSGTYAGAVVGDANPHNSSGGSYYSQGSLVYTPAVPVDMSTTSFLQVDWALNWSGIESGIEVYADGIRLSLLSEVAIPGGVYRRATFLCPDVSVASFRIKGPQRMESADGSGGPRSASLAVDQLVRTNQSPSGSTLRQKIMSVPILGSARAAGSLAVEHPTSALGDVIVYTYSDLGDGYAPDLRRWLTAGTATADASLVSGARNQWSGTTYAPPQRMLRPGPYLIVSRVRRVASTGVATLTAAGVSAIVDFPVADTWQVSTIGVLMVADHVADTSFSTTVALSTVTGTIEVDETWLFYVGDGAHLSQASLGVGAPSASGDSNRLWIDTPTLARPYPAMWRGTLADRSDARSALDADTEWGDHALTPPGITAFVVTTNALDAVTTTRGYPHWHTNAGL